ncbi:hypothetical protein KFL_001340240 [Klebsormidium nitens]|uniref:Uncharacterized protein n=1 Tax=Klebsormidium nitens TaxID=105231 RepID=A0A1Y1I0V0_KLENI|nr:hypothetical protein KFL_001340240 [Klebsormidium nitens]|eukprot:GAQ83069.1 hypothetical protein KFL_001340240 [Klebsormidium nitens]
MEGPWDHAKEQKAIMEKYAYSKEVQVVLGRMVKDLLLTQPSDPVPFMIEWLKAEESRRKGETETVTAKAPVEEHPVVAE